METRPTLFFEDVLDYFVACKMGELCEHAIAEEEGDTKRKIRKKKEQEWVNQDRARKLKTDGLF